MNNSRENLSAKLSVIIPAYNEEGTILELLQTVAAQNIEGVDIEVVVVDDCSVDSTLQILEENPDCYHKLVKLPRNSGKGGAVKAGLAEASGDYILFQDADLEYDPSDYASLMMPVMKHEADVVMGSRLMAPPYTRVHYFWHKQGNRFITLFFNIINNTTFTDIYSCYLLFRRDLIKPEELTTMGWEQHAEILTLTTKRSKIFYEVPISYHGRTYDQGKKIRAHHIISVLWTIFVKGISRKG
jgi:glycosyltransferase involved in cell wall biosynthesis